MRMNKQNRLYTAVVTQHFMIDMFNGVAGVILAALALPLAISNAQIGLTLTLYSLTGALSQPFFGWLMDRLPEHNRGLRPTPLLMSAVAVLWMAGLYIGVALLAGSWLSLLALLVLAALGSGLFHPIGTSRAATTSHSTANSATAMFFFIGQMGFAIGPFLGGVLFDLFGQAGIALMSLIAVPPVLLLLVSRNDSQPGLPRARAAAAAATDWGAIRRNLMRLSVLAFLVLVALRSSIHAAFQMLLPSVFAERGWEPWLYGLITGVVIGTAAFGNVVVARLADRYGLRLVVMGAMLGSVPASLLFLNSSSLPVIFVSAAISGTLIGGAHSVLVVHAQRLLPVKAGFAAGLILGFIFASGALGTWISGLLAESYNFQVAVTIITLFALPAALLALTLPGRPVAEEPAPTPAAVQPSQSGA